MAQNSDSGESIIEHGRELLRAKRGREAFEFYEQQIRELSQPIKVAATPRRLFLGGLLAGVVLMAVLVAAGVNVDVNTLWRRPELAWWEKARPVVENFRATADLARSTPRGMLSPVALQLQQIHQQFTEIDAPSKSDYASELINKAMTAELVALYSFMRDDPESNSLLWDADFAWRLAASAVEDLHLVMPWRAGT